MKPLDPVWKFFGRRYEKKNIETNKMELCVDCPFCKKTLSMGATQLKKPLQQDEEAGLISMENMEVIKFNQNEKKKAWSHSFLLCGK